ncbi:fatty-acid amide hydrolase 2-like [Centruroides vittatus]|uniref:fatty-acid amide hydrolase 2-like n=1 Tax=Centruroides vittatus TaxID=120091 RepID=UPI00350EB6F3
MVGRTSITSILVRIIFRTFNLLALLLFKLIYRGKKEEIPPITDLNLLEPAVSLATKIRSKKLRATDLIQSYINRIKEVQPIINAVADNRFVEAMEEARKVDELIHSGQKTEKELAEEKPFLGVPFTLKHSIAVKGMSFTSGFVPRKDVKATEDAGIVTLLKNAGAIPLINTNTSQLCMWWESSNNLYGTTNNPYDTSRTVGGSSGGEGAIIASAASVIGVGSDIAGSIRIPSFYNGIFGHKPSKGITPLTGKFPVGEGDLCDFLSTGPMCRYATDLLPLMKIMAGSNISRLKLDTRVDLKDVKFYYVEELCRPFLQPLTKDMKEAQKKVINYIEFSHKSKPTKVKLEKMNYAVEMWTQKAKSAKAPTFSSELACRKGEINLFFEFLKWFLLCSSNTLPALSLALYEKLTPEVDSEGHSYYMSMFTDIKNELKDLLEDNCVLIMPSFPEPAPYHFHSILKPMGIYYTCLFNALGLPVTQCPLGLNNTGLPLGVQIVSGMYNDHLSMAVAVDLEKAFGGWVSPSPIL